MITKLTHVTVLVHDQDEALRFYTQTLGMEKRMDQQFGPGARWLTVAPTSQTDVEIVLQSPDPAMQGEERAERLAKQIGQGPTWALATENCRAAHEELARRGVRFLSEPSPVPWGLQAVFEDPDGNSFALVESRHP